MKKIILCLCILYSAISGFSQVYYKYQIVDAGEANKIYNTTGGTSWTTKTNWPIYAGITFGYNIPYGIRLANGDTTIISYPPPAKDTGIVHLFIKELDLNGNNLSGVFPSINMDSLSFANFSGNQLTQIDNIQAPALKTLIGLECYF